MVNAPRVSIAAKLYAIFALLATATAVLAAVTVINARRHAALTDEFEAAYRGMHNVELINGLIYAAVMESRGVYIASDMPAVRKYAQGLLRFNERSVDVAAKRTGDTAEEVSRVGDASDNTRVSVTTVKTVAESLGAVASRIRDQVESFSRSLRAA